MSAPFGPKGIRAATIERVDDDADSRLVYVAISSEAPFERFFGAEILDHTEGAPDTSWIGSRRASVLMDHDHIRQVGVVESVSLDPDRVLRGVLRFSKSAYATEVLNDIRDGIRTNISVGYNIEKYEKLTGDVEGYLITKWKPTEVSIVSTPADETVGVGRSASMKNRSLTVAEDVETDENVLRGEAIAEALELGARRNLRAEMDAFLTPAVRRLSGAEILARARGLVLSKLPDGASAIGAPALHLDTDRPVDILNQAMRVADGKQPNGPVAEMSDELDQRYSRQKRAGAGFRVPLGAMIGGERAAITTANYAAIVNAEPQPGMYSEPLRKLTAIGRTGAKFLSCTSDIIIGRGQDPMTAVWVAEGDGPTDSAPTADTVTGSYKGQHVTGVITRRMNLQSNPAAEWLFREDGARAILGGIDLAAIAGTGTSGQPRGILNDPNVPVVSLGTNGRALAWSDIPPIPATVADANAGDAALAWLTNHKVKASLQTTPRVAGQAKFLLDDSGVGDDETLAGYKIVFGGNVPKNLTKGTGTNLSAMVFGDWREMIICQFGAVDVIIDPFTESAKGNVRVSLLSAWDVIIRRPQAFVIVKDIVA